MSELGENFLEVQTRLIRLHDKVFYTYESVDYIPKESFLSENITTN